MSTAGACLWAPLLRVCVFFQQPCDVAKLTTASPASVGLLHQPERLEVVGGRGLERRAGGEAVEEVRNGSPVRRLVVGIEIDLLRGRRGADQLERRARQAD